MVDEFSEENIRKKCPHCDPGSFALEYPLKKTDNFWVVCDVHPLTEGHILIIPRRHLSCIAEYPKEIYKEFLELYKRFSKFILDGYGSVATFEHGKLAQTVFHSHVHILPFKGSPSEIILEGEEYIKPIKDLSELRTVFKREGRYLFFSIGDQNWIVDTSISAPRFFRDRFAKALGVPERGDWKEMHKNKRLMKEAYKDIKNLEKRWKNYYRPQYREGT